MCRQNHLYGGCLLSFGLGLLVGTWITSGLVCHLFGVAVIVLGLGILRKH